MSALFSPKQIARAIQVSESSVKRWCDQGALQAQYTAGGHRKIPLSSLIEFVRSSGQILVHPEVVGLTSIDYSEETQLDEAGEQFSQALVAGDEVRCRQIVLENYLKEHSLGVILDRILVASMQLLGEKWSCGEADIYQERRGCEVITRIVHELRSFLSDAQAGSPIAIGGAVTGDPYRLPSLFVEATLMDCGWNALSLGENLPIATLERAINKYQPKLFWLSCSHLANTDQFLQEYNELQERYESQIAFVVGGRALTPDVLTQMKYFAHCENMQALEQVGQQLLTTSNWQNSESTQS